MNRWRRETGVYVEQERFRIVGAGLSSGRVFFLASTAVGGKFYFSDGRFD